MKKGTTFKLHRDKKRYMLKLIDKLYNIDIAITYQNIGVADYLTNNAIAVTKENFASVTSSKRQSAYIKFKSFDDVVKLHKFSTNQFARFEAFAATVNTAHYSASELRSMSQCKVSLFTIKAYLRRLGLRYLRQKQALHRNYRMTIQGTLAALKLRPGRPLTMLDISRKTGIVYTAVQTNRDLLERYKKSRIYAQQPITPLAKVSVERSLEAYKQHIADTYFFHGEAKSGVFQEALATVTDFDEALFHQALNILVRDGVLQPNAARPDVLNNETQATT